MDSLTVKFAGEILQDTDGYDFFKLYEDLFLTESGRSNWLGEGIQSEHLSKTRCNARDTTTSGADKEKKRLNAVYGNKYRIPIMWKGNSVGVAPLLEKIRLWLGQKVSPKLLQ